MTTTLLHACAGVFSLMVGVVIKYGLIWLCSLRHPSISGRRQSAASLAYVAQHLDDEQHKGQHGKPGDQHQRSSDTPEEGGVVFQG